MGPVPSSVAPQSPTMPQAITPSRPFPRTRRSVLATTLVAVRLPALATSTMPALQTTSRPVEEEAVASRGASGAEADTTAGECGAASTPTTAQTWAPLITTTTWAADLTTPWVAEASAGPASTAVAA